MFRKIYNKCEELVLKFEEIPFERKLILDRISDYIDLKLKQKSPVRLMYVCTHNSRRSQFGQIWAKVASEFYDFPEIQTFSGGTEVTSFNENALRSLNNTGFKISPAEKHQNPIYTISYGTADSLDCFSKVYNDVSNPTVDFAAIMTCSDAEENCPFIHGTDFRIATTYDDPKVYDNSTLCEEKYTESSMQIALETLYIFSKLEH